MFKSSWIRRVQRKESFNPHLVTLMQSTKYVILQDPVDAEHWISSLYIPFREYAELVATLSPCGDWIMYRIRLHFSIFTDSH